MKKTPEQLADEHAEWMIKLLTPIIRHIAKEEFLHGYKHGKQDYELPETITPKRNGD